MPEAKVVRLRAIEREDLQIIRDWRNSLKRYFREFRDFNMLHQEQWLESLTNDRNNLYYIVEMDETLNLDDRDMTYRRPIGVVGLTYISWINRRADLSIYIGADDLRGQGYGLAALDALHHKAFRELGLHKVELEVWASNPARDMYERYGYKHVGIWREHHFDDGKLIDTVLMELFAAEWIPAFPADAAPTEGVL